MTAGVEPIFASCTLMTKPVIAHLRGGLGNQLFIWAAGYSLSRRLSLPLVITTDDIDRLSKPGHERQFELGFFGIEGVARGPQEYFQGTKFFNRLFRPQDKRVFRESGLRFDPQFNKLRTSISLEGYFQSPRYFEDCQSEIRGLLLREAKPSQEARSILDELPQTWIGVHVRGSDYLKAQDYYALPSSDYYQSAIALARTMVDTDHAIVFTDDPKRAREVVPDARLILSHHEISSPGDVIWLLSHSSALVGANSSLSWWAAFLRADSSKPPVFPRPWYRDDIPSMHDLLFPRWITLGAEADRTQS